MIATFQINPRTTLFAYGDILYNPGGVEVSDDIMVHEEVHQGQQNGNPALWWGRYLREEEFRIQQEVEAYGKQYWYICTHKTQNKQTQFTLLKRFAELLSSPLYGSCVGLNRALQLIKQESLKHYA